MTDAAIIARLDLLEQHVAAFLPAPLERRANRYERPEWMTAMVLARRERAIDEAVMSFPVVGHIRINGLIDDAIVHSIQDQLEPLRFAAELTVEIDSRGGEFDPAIRAYKALRWHPATKKTAVLGKKCQSAAAIVMLACEHRVARPDTDILLHGVGSRPDPDEHWSVARHLTEIRRLADLDGHMLNLMADRTGLDLQTLAGLTGDEESTPLDEALRLGLIHEVRA